MVYLPVCTSSQAISALFRPAPRSCTVKRMCRPSGNARRKPMRPLVARRVGRRQRPQSARGRNRGETTRPSCAEGRSSRRATTRRRARSGRPCRIVTGIAAVDGNLLEALFRKKRSTCRRPRRTARRRPASVRADAARLRRTAAGTVQSRVPLRPSKTTNDPSGASAGPAHEIPRRVP